MRKLTLSRAVKSSHGTLGVLDGLGSIMYTFEEEDRGNQRSISRIPAGTYVCKRDYFHRGGYPTFEITGVPNRERILFHIGNTEENTEGCILVGEDTGLLRVRDEDNSVLGYKLAVLQSRNAFRRFMQVLEHDDTFLLEIRDEVA